MDEPIPETIRLGRTDDGGEEIIGDWPDRAVVPMAWVAPAGWGGTVRRCGDELLEFVCRNGRAVYRIVARDTSTWSYVIRLEWVEPDLLLA